MGTLFSKSAKSQRDKGTKADREIPLFKAKLIDLRLVGRGLRRGVDEPIVPRFKKEHQDKDVNARRGMDHGSSRKVVLFGISRVVGAYPAHEYERWSGRGFLLGSGAKRWMKWVKITKSVENWGVGVIDANSQRSAYGFSDICSEWFARRPGYYMCRVDIVDQQTVSPAWPI